MGVLYGYLKLEKNLMNYKLLIVKNGDEYRLFIKSGQWSEVVVLDQFERHYEECSKKSYIRLYSWPLLTTLSRSTERFHERDFFGLYHDSEAVGYYDEVTKSHWEYSVSERLWRRIE